MGNELFKNENLVNFGIQTTINLFFGGQSFESNIFGYICV